MDPIWIASPAARNDDMTERLVLAADAPFVLLEDARPGGQAELFRGPRAVLQADRTAEVPALLDALEAASGEGRVAAGWLAYEAASGLGLPAMDASGDPPLGWFGIFDAPEPVPDLADLLPSEGGGIVVGGEAQPDLARAEYAAAFDAVAEAIRAGTVYQANLTIPATAAIMGDPLSLYARLRRAAAAPFGAIVWTGERLVLSFSPELFFDWSGGRLTARPMKGTAPRRADPAADRAEARALSGDAKQRAENLMIVDLLRNDLSRVARVGSVAVDALFAIESYPTVHQMTSTVTAEARGDAGFGELIRALFPCGSITGAPKRAAVGLLAGVEGRARGVYCGAIGRVGPGRAARLSVAIRTLEVAEVGAAGEGIDARMGLGSGIVADSDPASEWAECLLKGHFLAAAAPTFDLIETLGYDPERGCERLDAHIARLAESATVLGFACDRHAVRNELQAATFGRTKPALVRLLLARGGAVAIELRRRPAPRPASRPLTAALAPIAVDARDLRRWHKTTDRAFYDRPRQASGADEVVFLDADGRVTEGSFTNVFVERDGTLLTPPASLGLIPGVLRAELLATGRAREADLTPADLAHGFHLGNAARGLMAARLRK